ncbi:hypothetical protein ED733_006653 [Metarhizium rileyi]|uniref:DUF7918 domain-containing protein n=1 Tax=Metarhizium rileyi (strain RCEF 4871) TaxID=1649241 RepID=A0A5C6GIF5_METRR|nr:hypothetical protein ED733_006653 [Metarhizium rileyi]
MPCFKGISVSIHANGAPLPEYGMQKQSRVSRISTYIPVPQPSLTAESNKPEPAKFAISITLLTPSAAVPYSPRKASTSNPCPKPPYNQPYIPMTNSANETIAAYIYFDGRAKEEVATLLRPGEETWVNSRWVQVPDAEGGGLAEREFLFREVGLERWLNGLDLQGHDAAEKLERRRQKFEKRRQRQALAQEGITDADTSDDRKEASRYGADNGSPIEAVLDSDSWSDDDDEPPEATGQIKVAMFRVLASGEIKKGEYSPQFDAHDGDDEAGNSDNVGADVEHTTSFAKPKSLDPKTISTQTVTGIDGPERPYAVFTFFYRGDRQLQKIGVMQSSKNPQVTPGSAKRRSGQLDLSNIGPLKAGGTVGFSAFRDQTNEISRRRKARKKSNGNIAEDSDEDDDESDNPIKMDDDDKDREAKEVSDDSKLGGELADGVKRIRLKRAHSADPDSHSTPESSQRGQAEDSPKPQVPPSLQPPISGTLSASDVPADGLVGSPLKKARASVDETSTGEKLLTSQSLSAALEAAVSAPSVPSTTLTTTTAPPYIMDEEEEL